MKAIIDGKTYNTETATEICELPCKANGGDFRWHSTSLYQTAKGTFFIAGEGGPLSMWKQSAHGGGWSGSKGLKVIDQFEAQEIMESAHCSAEVYEACGLTVEEG